MRYAINNNNKGIFSMPQDAFTHPYRPWDLRKLWHDPSLVPLSYLEYREILNSPVDPEPAWWPASEPCANNDECSSESQRGDSFFFRVVPSKMSYESLCFKATSAIPEAGSGLFLRPHGTIPKGSHLCLYSTQSTTEEAMLAADSSRDYALQTGKDKLWFDAESEDANNLGWFANQPGVIQLLQKVKELSQKSMHPEFFDTYWKEIEDEAVTQCNAKYHVIAGTLSLCTTKELMPTRDPQEIFTHYGSLRKYWICAIAETPHKYPKTMADCVISLLNSPDYMR